MAWDGTYAAVPRGLCQRPCTVYKTPANRFQHFVVKTNAFTKCWYLFAGVMNHARALTQVSQYSSVCSIPSHHASSTFGKQLERAICIIFCRHTYNMRRCKCNILTSVSLLIHFSTTRSSTFILCPKAYSYSNPLPLAYALYA